MFSQPAEKAAFVTTGSRPFQPFATVPMQHFVKKAALVLMCLSV